MANMSYCRFRNTKQDLANCLNALDPYENEHEISEDEVSAGKRMFTDFLNYCEAMEIIDGFDSGRIAEVFEEHNAIVNEEE